jgi:quercetin dioxygenase-like cupin family protein
MKVNRGREPGSVSDLRGPTFTGPVWADAVLNAAPAVLINSVFFPPGSRTFWHRHESGQILHVTHGRGHIQKRGAEGFSLQAGDVVYIEPGEEHWHGATPDSFMLHLAISLGETEWLDEVVQDDYLAHCEQAPPR